MIKVKKGDRYGRLKIVRELPSIKYKRKDKGGISCRRRVLCKCDCGNKIKVLLSSIRTGNTKSCGCLKNEKIILRKGQRFNRLTIIKEIAPKNYYSSGNPVRRFLCKCDCGNKTEVDFSRLNIGRAKSCGCLAIEIAKQNKNNFKHGMYKKPAYKSWASMKQRCLNKKNPRFNSYGGRGIKVCKSWMRFENFYKDMGDRPVGKTLDRIDNESGYCKDNCRWATRSQQQSNKRDNIFVSVNGVKISFNELALMFNLNRYQLHSRIFRSNWPIEKALSNHYCGKYARH